MKNKYYLLLILIVSLTKNIIGSDYRLNGYKKVIEHSVQNILKDTKQLETLYLQNKTLSKEKTYPNDESMFLEHYCMCNEFNVSSKVLNFIKENNIKECIVKLEYCLSKNENERYNTGLIGEHPKNITIQIKYHKEKRSYLLCWVAGFVFTCALIQKISDTKNFGK
jgi:hypothetical protein